jgi:hydroxyacylglutathione hydrolase
MIQIYPIPAFQDNYLWLFHRQGYKDAYVVDPGDAAPIIEALQERSLSLAGILITHHHLDHTGGIATLLDYHRQTSDTEKTLPVYGPDSPHIPLINHKLKEKDCISLTGDIQLEVIEIPGHTLDHIAYFGGQNGSNINHSTNNAPQDSQDVSAPLLFCGDTLFAGGCGRLFEGSPAQMYSSLEKLATLPDNTLVCCAHEYTLANLNFALAVESNNEKLQQRIDLEQQKRSMSVPTLPSNIAREKATNPFLRCGELNVKSAAELKSGETLTHPEDVLAVIRAWKDNF